MTPGRLLRGVSIIATSAAVDRPKADASARTVDHFGSVVRPRSIIATAP